MAKKKSKSKSTRVSLEKSASSGITSERNERNDEATVLPPGKAVAFLKLCRLCESKDGPFLDIFMEDKLTAKKMDQLLPFSVSEQDGLPHKICFRCSAKVEELYEFVQKCTKSQENLRKAMGLNAVVVKSKSKHLWEEKLIKFKMSNGDICEQVVKKAMEDIKNIPINNNATDEEFNKPLRSRIPEERKKHKGTKREYKNINADGLAETDNVPLKQIKLLDNQTDRAAVKSSRSSNTPEPKLNQPINSGLETPKRESNIPTKNLLTFDFDDSSSSSSNSKKEEKSKATDTVPMDTEDKKSEKPFDIMDHVSTIKVNGVGILFQCKLCNRNFLKKEVVMAHGCAKTGIPKVDLTKNVTPPPEPPKMPTVKYINTKTDDLKSTMPNKPDEKPPPAKPKPRIGPASKVRKNDDSNPTVGMVVQPRLEMPPTSTVPPTNTTIAANTIINAPSLNSRYKLVPGPNNTFSLVEENNSKNAGQDVIKNSKNKKHHSRSNVQVSKPVNSDVIDLDDNDSTEVQNTNKPYPVSFFATTPQMNSIIPPEDKTHASHTSNQVSLKPATNPAVPPPHFTTPAMKKQSYTIVQTGNPSKLLISTKPPQNTPVEEPKRKTRKSKSEGKEDTPKQPFNVILEEASPPKDAGFFTYVNIDPLLQPTYGVPGDKIIQESQITTSTTIEKSINSDGKYTCNMCNEVFSREKKLLTHIQAHYSKMDEEDKSRSGGKAPKKKGKRST